MDNDLLLLLGAAVSFGVGHTLAGPDHYLPFVAMSRVGNWSLRKTITVTVLCGIAHVASSVVIGLVGVALGIVVLNLETVEAARGDLAGWLLLAFGLAYFVWGLHAGIRNRAHTHWHKHGDGTLHEHQRASAGEHLHATGDAAASPTAKAASMTPWVLFVIFLLGPCEPLIPFLMYPAANASMPGVVLVAALFGLATLVTMTSIVVAMYLGADFLRLGRFERWSHAAAGAVVLCCGLAIMLGL